MRGKIRLYEDTLRYLHSLGMTRVQIAEYLDLDKTAVQRRCKALGLGVNQLQFEHQHDDAIRNLYEQGWTQQAIADKLFFSKTNVYRREKAMGLVRNNYRYTIGDTRDDEIRNLHEMGLCQRQIAIRLGLSRDTVRKRMRKMHLKINRYHDRSRLSHKEIDQTMFLYCNCGMGMKQVAKTLGLAYSTVQYRLKRAGVQIRPLGTNGSSKIEKTPVHIHESRTTWASEDALRFVRA